MGIVRERATAHGLPVWVRHEHLARYRFAAGYVGGLLVVDCASGDGTGSALFAETACGVQAFDVSAEAVETAARDHPAANLTFAVGDATNLRLPDASVDVFISLETIEHVPNDRACVREAARVLKPGGLYICSTPDRTVCNPGTTIDDRPFNRFHIREYSRAEFTALLGAHFPKVEMFGQNPRSHRRTRFVGRLGRVLPFRGAVKLNQVLKLPRFLTDELEHHAVMPADPAKAWEYLVAVCRKPE